MPPPAPPAPPRPKAAAPLRARRRHRRAPSGGCRGWRPDHRCGNARGCNAGPARRAQRRPRRCSGRWSRGRTASSCRPRTGGSTCACCSRRWPWRPSPRTAAATGYSRSLRCGAWPRPGTPPAWSPVAAPAPRPAPARPARPADRLPRRGPHPLAPAPVRGRSAPVRRHATPARACPAAPAPPRRRPASSDPAVAGSDPGRPG